MSHTVHHFRWLEIRSDRPEWLGCGSAARVWLVDRGFNAVRLQSTSDRLNRERTSYLTYQRPILHNNRHRTVDLPPKSCKDSVEHSPFLPLFRCELLLLARFAFLP